MTTSDAQMIARALQEALNGAALKALRAAAEAVRGGASSADSVNAVLGADAPREVRNVVATLAAAGRLNSLEAVAKAFESATSRGTQALEATVTSAVTLSDEEQATTITDLRGKYGEGLVVHFAVDESLIGGLIVRVGDQVLDNSLRTRLSAVQRSMLTS
ncbi:MAG: ATP synthase F1 subunit delta [Chloroflexia bacterium]|nr:ATP synthase F1 subunit delta [Chloroflexia bacterium]